MVLNLRYQLERIAKRHQLTAQVMMTSSDDSDYPCKRQKLTDFSTEMRQHTCQINATPSRNMSVNKTTFLTLPRELRHQILLFSYDLERYLGCRSQVGFVLIPYIRSNSVAISRWCEIMGRVSQNGCFIEDVEFCRMVFLKSIVKGQNEEDRSWCAKDLGVQYP